MKEILLSQRKYEDGMNLKTKWVNKNYFVYKIFYKK